MKFYKVPIFLKQKHFSLIYRDVYRKIMSKYEQNEY